MFHFIFLAAGFSRRYGKNKLLEEWEGRPMYQIGLSHLCAVMQERSDVDGITVVTQYDEIESWAEQQGIIVIRNEHSERGVSSSMKLGLEGVYSNAAVFFVADQPYLTGQTVCGFLDAYMASGKKIGVVCANGHRGNPVIFSGDLFDELCQLEGDEGGRQILSNHKDEILEHEVPESELKDVDEQS